MTFIQKTKDFFADKYYWIKSYFETFLGTAIGVLVLALALVVLLLPFGVHIVTCFQTGAILLLLVGILFIPYGWLHGLGILFGWW